MRTAKCGVWKDGVRISGCGKENLERREFPSGEYMLIDRATGQQHVCDGSLPVSQATELVEFDVRSAVENHLNELIPDTVAVAVQTSRPKIRDAVREEWNRIAPIEHQIVVTGPNDERRTINGRPHPELEFVIDLLSAGQIPFLYGPAGSGKTSAAMQAAEALGVQFYATSFGPESGAGDTLGFPDANGNTVRTQFRDAWEHGGLWIGDECDAGPGDHMIPVNMALGNGHCAFPDGIVPRHPKFYAMMGANTAGSGGTDQYQRHQIDYATRNRFAMVAWEYDEDGEVDWAGRDQKEWVQHVQKLRHAAIRLGINSLVISPRASINGAAMLRKYGDKYNFDKLDDTYIWQGCTADDKRAVLAVL